MPKRIELKPLELKELKATLGQAKVHSIKLPKTKVKRKKELNAQRATWSKNISPPKKLLNKLTHLKAQKINQKNLSSLTNIHLSTTPTAEAIKNQDMDSDIIEGTLYTSLVTYNYIRMQSEYKKRMNAARTTNAKKKVEAQWIKIQKGAQMAYNAGGLNLKTKDIDSQARELLKSKTNFNTVAKVVSSAKSLKIKSIKLDTNTKALSSIVTHEGLLKLTDVIDIVIPDLCSRPFVEGSYTKHFSKSFSLSFNIRYWCPTWRNWGRMCTKRVTLASLSFSADLDIGYKVDCCGASAWGQASAQVCGSILGVTKCASCTATVVGVAGFSRTGTGRRCTYGLGINASLICKFGNTTILNLQMPIGWNINGPCPPPGIC